MIESLSAIMAADKGGDSLDSANFHDKSLEEFHQHVQVPKNHGIVSDVVDVLNRQIGAGPLDIQTIATALNLSKRTLQRRLQKNSTSFVTLRDKVRFKHAMVCLLEKKMSIESTANHLSFSDRISFTNAFKHWSGLSPSVFRRKYSDSIR